MADPLKNIMPTNLGAAVGGRRRMPVPMPIRRIAPPDVPHDPARREAAFRALFDQAPVGMLVFDDTGIIERANAALGRLLGLDPIELVARHVTEIAPDLSPEAIVDAVHQLQDGAADHVRFESELDAGRGPRPSARLSVSSVRNGDDRIVTFLAFVEDVTAERTERASRLVSEGRLRAALDAAMDSFVLLRSVDGPAGPDFEIVDLNARGELLFGSSRSEIAGRRLSSLFDGQVLAAIMPTYLRVLRTGEPIDEEVELRAGDQTFVLHHQVVAAAEGVAVMSRDVTEERLEERRRRQEQQIAEAIFERSPIGIQLFDATGTSARMNEALRALLGLPSTSYGIGAFNILDDGFTAITGEAAAFRRAYDGETVGEFEYDVDMGAAENLWSTRTDAVSLARTIFPLRDEAGTVTGVVSFSRDVTERALLERRLEFLAYHDPLTQLPNRVVLTDRLGHALASRRPGFVAVAMVDLDGFKAVNDTLGHAVGDRLLQHVAACLTGAVRDGDTVSRLGGDEFAVVLDDIAGVPEARIVAERALARLGTPIDVDGGEVRAWASVGVILAARGAQAADAMLAADVAMYEAKTSGKGRVTVCPDPVTRAEPPGAGDRPPR